MMYHPIVTKPSPVLGAETFKEQAVDMTCKNHQVTQPSAQDGSQDTSLKDCAVTESTQTETPHVYQADGGWLQLKDTAVPYVRRGDQAFMPVSVLKYAAQLLKSTPVCSTPAYMLERIQLNRLCELAGLNFSFRDNTQLLGLKELQQLCPGECEAVRILPREDPFQCFTDAEGDERPLQKVFHQVSNQPSKPSASHHYSRAGPGDQGLIPAPPGDCQDTSLKEIKLGAEKPRPAHQQHNVFDHKLKHQQPCDRNSSENKVVVIKPVRFYGLVISCLMDKSDCFTPVEAFHMTYFSQVPEARLIRLLKHEMCVSLKTLSVQEEQAFVSYFGLKVSRLRWNLAVSLNSLMDKMSSITQRLNVVDAVGTTDKSKTTSFLSNQRDTRHSVQQHAQTVPAGNHNPLKKRPYYNHPPSVDSSKSLEETIKKAKQP